MNKNLKIITPSKQYQLPESLQTLQSKAYMEKKVVIYALLSDKHTISQYKDSINELVHYVYDKKEWRLVRIYFDKVKGNGSSKQNELDRLTVDADKEGYDYVLCRNFSDFGNIPIEAIDRIRKLQYIGTNVLFLHNRIDTSNAFSEMLLTVLRAFALEENSSDQTMN